MAGKRLKQDLLVSFKLMLLVYFFCKSSHAIVKYRETFWERICSRVVDLRSRGRYFETHRREVLCCILEQDTISSN